MSDELPGARARVARMRAGEDIWDVYTPIMRRGGETPILSYERDVFTIIKADAAAHPADDWPVIWTDEQCFVRNASQHDHRLHGYTCGNDSGHRPLIATRQGWRCADCGYRQGWAHEIGEPPIVQNQE